MGDNVTKYELYYAQDGGAELRAHPCGDWVCYEAYAELLEKFNKALIEMESVNRVLNIKYFDWR